ncbi:hypothetical protein [Isoalcanivorax pacificus]|uniref:hypothetical protein n=1 Tax=Isoalcanivorax pacificus TaxID=1306787 RepID=UPI0011855498|nr:hypothetical protein [Isoalcanivorax pacificus]
MKIEYKRIRLECQKTGLYGSISIRKAAEVTGRSVRTAHRWADTGNIEPPSLRLLEMHVFGWLPFPEWDGWRINGDTLFEHRAHHSYWWDRSRLEGWWFLRQFADDWRRELQRITGRHIDYWSPNGSIDQQHRLERQNTVIQERLLDRLSIDADFLHVDNTMPLNPQPSAIQKKARR